MAAAQLTFRAFDPVDGALIARWLVGAGLGVPEGIEVGTWSRRIVEDGRIECVVAELDGRMAGFYRLDLAPDRSAELTLLVAPAVRRCGFGTQLTEHALQNARARRLRRLVAVVGRDNSRALRFFTGTGFELSGSHVPGFDHLERWVHGADRERPLEIVP